MKPMRIATPYAAPGLTVPGAQTTNEDTSKDIAATIVAFAGTAKITITATHGVVTLASLTGLTFTAGDGTADGTMTFTADTLAHLNAALATLTFEPAANYNGSASIVVRAAHASYAHLYSEQTIAVTVTAVDDAPVVTTSGGSTAYTENGSALVVDGALTVTDVDSANLVSGYAQITGGFQSGQDVLSVTDALGITAGSFNTTTGRLDLTGTATPADWQSLLRTVKYSNSSDDPNTSNRTVTFVVNDGTSSSSAATKTVTVAAQNDAPVVTTSGGSTAYTENGSAVTIDGALTVADADNANLASGYAQITGNLQIGADVLAATGSGGISVGSYNPATGRIDFTGSASPATYQAVLRSVTYANSSENPSTSGRTVTFVVNDGTVDSTAATKSVSVTAVNDPPSISTSGGTTSYTQNAAAAAIDAALTITDPDNANLASATVQITSGYQTGDVLAHTDGGGVTWSWDSGTQTLTGTGSVSSGVWQTKLREVTFAGTSSDESDRVISFVVNDGTANSTAATKTISYSSSEPEAALWASYPFTSNANDASGNNRHGTLNGSSTIHDGSLDVHSGVSEGGVLVANADSLDFKSPFTAAIAAKIDETSEGLNSFFAKDQDESWDGDAVFWLVVTGGEVNVAVNGDLGYNDGGDYLDGEWHHFAVTVDETTVTIYVDGVQTAQHTGSSLFTGVSTQPMEIGNHASTTEGCEAYLANAKLYEGVLDPSAIAALATEDTPS